MKKILKTASVILIAVVMITAFTGCGEIEKAEETVNAALTSLQTLDFEGAATYIDVDSLFEDGDEEEDSDSVIAMEDNVIMKNIFNKMTYRIISSEKTDKNTVIVKTEITAVKMQPVMKEFAGKAIQYAFVSAFSNPQPTEEEMDQRMEEIFVECLSKEDLEMMTTVVDIKVVRVDNKWQIEKSEELTAALTGGLNEAVDAIDKELEDMWN